MRVLFILLILVSCGKQKHEIEIKEPDEMPEVVIDGPEDVKIEVEDSEHLIGFDFEAIRDWCIGKVEHQIEECNRINIAQICTDMELDKDYLVNECYYDFDLSALNQGAE